MAADGPGHAALVAAGSVAGHPVLVEPVPLRYTVAGLFTAFAAGPTTTALITPRCTYICNRNRLGALAGVRNDEAEAFYRGEGRLSVPPWWQCVDLRELATHFKARGFPTRASGALDGGVQVQLLQQGYVNQGTASMSRSFEVALVGVPGGLAQPEEALNAAAVTECGGRARPWSAAPHQLGPLGQARLRHRHVDMQHCPNCGGGELKIIAAILERPVIEKILKHLRSEPQPLPKGPGRPTGPHLAA